jgi:hypothetical protein
MRGSVKSWRKFLWIRARESFNICFLLVKKIVILTIKINDFDNICRPWWNYNWFFSKGHKFVFLLCGLLVYWNNLALPFLLCSEQNNSVFMHVHHRHCQKFSSYAFLLWSEQKNRVVYAHPSWSLSAIFFTLMRYNYLSDCSIQNCNNELIC